MGRGSGGGGRSVGSATGGRSSGFKRGDFVKTDTGLRGLVISSASLGTKRNPIPAYRLDIGGGRTTVIAAGSVKPAF